MFLLLLGASIVLNVLFRIDVRTLPLLAWTRHERARVIEILRRDSAHPQKFVRAWALDGLANLAQGDAELMAFVLARLRKFDSSGSKALAARAGHIRERLASTNPDPASLQGSIHA